MSLPKIRGKLGKDLKKIIPEIVRKDYNFELSEFPSKNNSVINIIFDKKPLNLPKEFVIKIFHTVQMATEINILRRLKNQHFNVPKVLLFKLPYLILEKVNGVNLCDFINDNLKAIEDLEDLDSDIKNQITISIDKLAEWLAELHKKNIVRKKDESDNQVLNKGDTRLRDFIIDLQNNVMYGVDFEDAYEGNHIDDLAWICCSLLDTNPGIFEMQEPKPKIDLINLFLKKYYKYNYSFEFDFDYLAGKIIENLNIVIGRRNLPFGSINKNIFLQDISKQI